MYDKKEVGKRIKALRKERNMTQEKLSESIGFEASTICKFETGSQSLSIEYALLLRPMYFISTVALSRTESFILYVSMKTPAC